jgi:hypothetical protein
MKNTDKEVFTFLLGLLSVEDRNYSRFLDSVLAERMVVADFPTSQKTSPLCQTTILVLFMKRNDAFFLLLNNPPRL